MTYPISAIEAFVNSRDQAVVKAIHSEKVYAGSEFYRDLPNITASKMRVEVERFMQNCKATVTMETLYEIDDTTYRLVIEQQPDSRTSLGTSITYIYGL